MARVYGHGRLMLLSEPSLDPREQVLLVTSTRIVTTANVASIDLNLGDGPGQIK